MHRWKLGAAAALVVFTALLSGCAAAPAPATTAAKSAYLPCILSDEGGFHDHSLEELSYDGVKQAATTLGVAFKAVQSNSPSDYTPNVKQLVRQKCSLIVAAGFNLVDTVKSLSKTYPKTDFAMVDDDSIKSPNVKPVVYATDEAAFEGGYAAAAYSKTGIVATYGGEQQPPVTLYMDGFYDGVQYFNQQNHENVKVFGWNEKTQKGTFVGNFTDQNASKTIASNFLNAGADVILPVAGGLYQGAGAAIKADGGKAVLVGVDSDLAVADTSGYKALFLASILKNIQPTVATVVGQAGGTGAFDNSVYVGTSKNGGVGLSSFHGFASKVPASLAGQLSKISAGIIAGTITIDSPSSLTK